MFRSVYVQNTGLKIVNVIFEMWFFKKRWTLCFCHTLTLDIRKQLQAHVKEPLEWKFEPPVFVNVAVCVCTECQSCVIEDNYWFLYFLLAQHHTCHLKFFHSLVLYTWHSWHKIFFILGTLDTRYSFTKHVMMFFPSLPLFKSSACEVLVELNSQH